MYKDKEWLYNKYIDEKLSSNQIGERCNVSKSTIRKRLGKFNIDIRSNGEALHLKYKNHCNLSQEAREWINGELLGDGHLRSQSKYSASFSYASKHIEYIEYIRDTLKSFGIEQAGKINKRHNTYKNMDCYSYQYGSRAYPELMSIRKQWYPNGKKIVPRDIKLTPLVCRQWYIGDGCLAHPKHSINIALSTCGFLIEDVGWLAKQLVLIGVKANRYKANIIHISAYSVADFLNYIGICPVECYKYKWEY